MMKSYYPECDGLLFNENLPTEAFASDEEAIGAFQAQYGTCLMAVVRDEDPQLTIIYERSGAQTEH